PPPPIPPLFPYTTLFRSLRHRHVCYLLYVSIQRRYRQHAVFEQGLDRLAAEFWVHVLGGLVVAVDCQKLGFILPAEDARTRIARDRKSTRLNSSHLVISY